MNKILFLPDFEKKRQQLLPDKLLLHMRQALKINNFFTFFINQFLYLQVKRSLNTVTELYQFRGSICIKVNCFLPPPSQKILQSGGNQMLLQVKGVF